VNTDDLKKKVALEIENELIARIKRGDPIPDIRKWFFDRIISAGKSGNELWFNDLTPFGQAFMNHAHVGQAALAALAAMSMSEQVPTRLVTLRSIVASREFARGVEEVRKGLPFNPDNDNWNYERGRCFGFIAPLDMPLRIHGALNPKALALADAAFDRKLLR